MSTLMLINFGRWRRFRFAQGQAAVGEPVKAKVVQVVPQAAGTGLVHQCWRVAGTGGSRPRAVWVSHPGRSDSGLVIGVAADDQTGGGDGQDCV
jgi:hypothetical protein